MYILNSFYLTLTILYNNFYRKYKTCILKKKYKLMNVSFSLIFCHPLLDDLWTSIFLWKEGRFGELLNTIRILYSTYFPPKNSKLLYITLFQSNCKSIVTISAFMSTFVLYLEHLYECALMSRKINTILVFTSPCFWN